jgi:thymidylate kinase
VIISVVGADGSGKSTVSRDIGDFLGWKLDVRHFYLGEGRDSSSMRLFGYFQRFVARALTPVLGRKKKGERISPRSATRAIEEPESKGRVLSYLAEISFALERILIVWEKRRKLTRIMRARGNGAIVVTDRFPQTRIAGLYDGPRYGDRAAVRGVLPRLAARMERRFFASLDSMGPDSVLRLHVTAEIALRRKPDRVTELILKKVQSTEAISFPGAVHVDIDATRPLDVVLREARLRTWESL